MKNLFVSLMVMVAVNLTASSAHADDCSESDRVALPLCAKSGLIQGTIVGRFVQNLCSHPITVKFAQSGSDVRRDIPAGTWHEEKPLANDVAVSCCPRYNSCEDHRPGMPPNLALRKPATQSSVQNDAVAARAVDGNSDGDYHHWSVTHTTSTAQSWWQVDLGVPQGLRELTAKDGEYNAATDRPGLDSTQESNTYVVMAARSLRSPSPWVTRRQHRRRSG